MSSEALVQTSLVVGLALSGLSLSLLAAAILMRARFARRDREARQTLAKWFPYFLEAAVGVPRPAPPLADEDPVPILSAWLDLIESASGPIRARLCSALAVTSLTETALQLVQSRTLSERILAISVVGHLKDERAWDILSRILDRGGTTALVAGRALVQIDPERALPIFIAKVRRRIDWPLPTIASILLEARPDYACQVLAEEIGRAEATREEACQAGLLQLATTVSAERAQALVSARLSPELPSVVLVTALRAVERSASAHDLPAVRPLLAHPSAEVRAEAARALGRIGERLDEQALIATLNDPDAWVRYCAAQALSFLPWIELGDLRRIRDEVDSSTAKTVLQQVASEMVSASSTLDGSTDEHRLDLKNLREFLAHGNWKIRLQAAERLTLVESRTGQRTLHRLLDDERWWTQFEAARRLMEAPHAGPEALQKLQSAPGDERTRSVLTMVLRENTA